MGAFKHAARKKRYSAARKVKAAPRWVDLKKYNKRARTRRVRVHATKHWRRSRLKL